MPLPLACMAACRRIDPLPKPLLLLGYRDVLNLVVKSPITDKRIFTIHAGTHKTASTYIQNRLFANSKLLAAEKIYNKYPQKESLKFKPLVSALHSGDWDAWSSYLRKIPPSCSHAIVSAEQFAQPLADPKIFNQLNTLLRKNGFKTQVVIFLRDQPDYLNARFAHSTRRLYHHASFEDYISQQLKKGRHLFDYEYLFKDLVAEPDIRIHFLPFLSSLGDPFERLMDCIDCKPNKSWKPATEEEINIQAGHKGVWLAQETGKRLLSEYNIIGGKTGPLRNTGAVIRSIAEREGWTKDRFYGFDQSMLENIIKHYAECNDRFSEKIWGKPWRSIYPMPQAKQKIYELPASGAERNRMLLLVDEATKALVGNLKQTKH